MANKKPGIPIVNTGDRAVILALNAMKENIELITGVRPGTRQISTLGTSASTSDMISKINEIVTRINYSGE
jgi:hypothetical protein